MNKDNRPQIDRFKDAARELKTDDDESHFDERLRRIAKSPAPKRGKDQDDKPGQ